MSSFITRFIPVEIKIKTLYWKKLEQEMEGELKTIFEKIDNDDFEGIPILIDNFRNKWGRINMPIWLAIKSTEVSRAEAMYNFLVNDLMI